MAEKSSSVARTTCSRSSFHLVSFRSACPVVESMVVSEHLPRNSLCPETSNCENDMSFTLSTPNHDMP